MRQSLSSFLATAALAAVAPLAAQEEGTEQAFGAPFLLFPVGARATADVAAVACPDTSADSYSGISDMLLLLACFIAFPLGLMMSGLPNLLVIFAAAIHKLRRRQRFPNGILALIVALSLIGLAAGAFRTIQPLLGAPPTP